MRRQTTGEVTVERSSLDAPEVRGLVRRARQEMRDLYPEALVPPGRSSRPEQFAPPEGLVLLARVDGRAAGCGGVRRLDPGVGEVKRMYVGPQFRRAGVASAILTGLEDGARSLGYGALRLETGIRQPQAIALYQSFGYRPIPYFDGYVGIDVSRCFEKDLDSRLGE